MRIKNYTDARSFLQDTVDELEANEAANNLMLGVCGQLVSNPERFTSAPCFKTVWDEEGLLIAALMTPPFNIVLYGNSRDLAGGCRLLAKEIYNEGWELPGVLGPGGAPAEFARAWEETGGHGYHLVMRQRVYQLTEVFAPPPERGRMRLAKKTDLKLVSQWFYEFYEDISKKVSKREADRLAKTKVQDTDVFLWEDGRVVSIAARSRPTKSGISIIMVYTPPAERGKGYATACVSTLCRNLLADGWRFVNLFADLANPVSNHVYQKIGFQFVTDYDEFRF